MFNPTTTYPQTGYYNVCLTIYDSTGCQSSYCDSVYVTVAAGTCQAAFTTIVSGNAAAFTNTSTGTNPNTAYSWNFGDGTTSTSSNPNHTYTASGTYYVCLTIYVNNGGGAPCTSTYCQYITIAGAGGCQAYFYYTANGGTVTFNNQSQGGTNYNWNFGNGQTSTVFNPTTTYPQTGYYNVCLTIYDSTGCQSIYCDSVYVTVAAGTCQAAFTTIVSGNAAAFTNTSTGTNPNTAYSWDFGDGTTSTSTNPNHTYTASGTYYVCLSIYVYNPGGAPCTSLYCQYITIAPVGGCQAYFTYIANGGTVSFTNQSQGGSFQNWNFGNGQISSLPNPSATYTQTGWYNVCLTVYDSTCQSTYCDSIYVTVGGAGCSASFTYQIIGSTGGVAFSGMATGAAPFQYSWSFGVTQQNPTITYQQNGQYIVCLVIVDSTGCTATYCDTIYMTLLALENAFVSQVSELYPNPTQASAAFDLDLKEKANITVEVLNMVGQSISVENKVLSDGTHSLSVPTQDLAQGMYWVRISAEGQFVATKRLIKE